MDHLDNLLGAAAVAISDALSALMKQQAGLKLSASSVILTLGQHDLLTITEIAKIAGITHSATVRLIDGLECQKLVLRKRGESMREVAVSLTERGRNIYSTLRQAQAEILEPLLSNLLEDERQLLESALSRILVALTSSRERADHICRFCDEGVCHQDHCPVERQARKLEHA
jgi:MarR family transcriptional repressor of emrRAB